MTSFPLREKWNFGAPKQQKDHKEDDSEYWTGPVVFTEKNR